VDESAGDAFEDAIRAQLKAAPPTDDGVSTGQAARQTSGTMRDARANR
jgi:hypothetical protein